MFGRNQLVLWVSLASACVRPPHPSEDSPVVPTESAVPEVEATPEDVFGSAQNLVLLHIDTLSAAHTPWYGYERDTMPLLHARSWNIVDGYRATASWTGSATASVLTALPVERHRVLWSAFDGDDRGGGAVNEPMAGDSVAELLSAQGYATGLWSGNAFVVGSGRLDRGFDVAVYTQKVNGASNAAALAEEALAFLDTVPAEQPFFLMLQPMDTHTPFAPDERDFGTWTDTEGLLFDLSRTGDNLEDQYRVLIEDPALVEEAHQQWVDLYDEQLLGLDRALDGLLTELEARGRLENTLVVLTADHGEALGELDPQVVGHGKSYRPEVLRLPLLVLDPTDDPERISCLSSGEDLAPTLLRAMGRPALEGVTGLPMQERCRTETVSSFYLPDQLRFLSAEDEAGMLLLDCAGARVQGLDLAANPWGGAMVDPDDLTRLRPALEAAFADQAAVTDISACEGVLSTP